MCIGRGAEGAAEAVVEAFAPVVEVPVEGVLAGRSQRCQGSLVRVFYLRISSCTTIGVGGASALT